MEKGLVKQREFFAASYDVFAFSCHQLFSVLWSKWLQQLITPWYTLVKNTEQQLY